MYEAVGELIRSLAAMQRQCVHGIGGFDGTGGFRAGKQEYEAEGNLSGDPAKGGALCV